VLSIADELTRLYYSASLSLVGVCFQPPCLVTELLDTSLFAVLHTDRIQLSQKQKVHIALGVARGVASLHGHAVPIVHRDLKSLNVLVSNDFKQGGVGLVKICDLGMVKTKAAQGQRLDASGTPNWMAPEVLMNQPYDEQADVYSFGCVLYELLSGTVPYAGAEFTRDRIAERVGKGDRPALPKGLQKGWQDLIVGCWQHHPRSRPTMAKVVEMIQAIPTE
jgi:serine/threonine protein kinase